MDLGYWKLAEYTYSVMLLPNDKDNLKKADDLLNKPGSGFFERKRSHLTALQDGVLHDWSDTVMSKNRSAKMSGTRVLLVLALLFFVGAVGVASYLFFGGINVVSGDNIDIAVNGPVSVKGGEPVSFEVLLANNNNTPLEVADLLVTFPEGTRAVDDVGKSLTRYRKSIGTVEANQTVSETIKAIFYGKENNDEELIIGFEYRTSGSNAIFAKEKKFPIRLSSAPVTISVVAPSDANSGQEITLVVKSVSNTREPQKGLLTHVLYPPGFLFRSAEPMPIAGTKDTWSLGDLQAQGSRTITLHGTIDGQDDEIKSFQVATGARGTDDTENKIIVPYSSVSQTLTMKRPFIALTTRIAGSADDTVVSEGNDIIHADVEWVNTLPSRVMDGELKVRLVGAVLDQQSVAAVSGFYRSTDNTIVWNKSTVPELANMEAGASGSMNFSFSSFALLTSGETLFKQPAIELEFVFTGTRIADSNGTGGRIETILRKKVKFTTVTQLVSRIVHYVGPLVNTGTLPPKVGKETSYTVIWSVVNSSNDLTNAIVKASLPNYVHFLSKVTPQDEQISYDARTGEVKWQLGAVKAGSGLTLPVREVAFQVGFTPSLSQADLIVPLIGDATLTGTDDFTQVARASTKSQLTTELSTDPKAKEGEYRVAR